MFFEQTRIFQQGLSNRTCFFKEGLSVRRTDLYYFIEQILISQKPLLSPRKHMNFPRTSIFSSNRYSISQRRPYLVLEHIPFSLCLEQIGIFQEGTPPPPSNRYFVNRSQWLLLRLGRQNFVLYIHEHTKHVHIKIPIESVRFEIQVTLNCDSYILPNEKIKSASFWFMARINLLKNKTIDVDDALLW